MKRAVLAATMIGLLGTFMAITLGYADYSMLGISLEDALLPVWKWPIFTISIMLTSMSLTVPFAAYFFRATHNPAESLAAYGVAFLWVPFFLFYPGVRVLGVISDGSANYSWFGVCLAQYLAAKVVLKAIYNEDNRRAT